jgi:hypothetical protein
LNEVVWDLRLVEEGTDGEPMDPGPRVVPGTYSVTLEAGGVEQTRDAAVRLDPRVQMSAGQIAARQSAMMDAYRLSGPTEQAEDALEEMGDRLAEIRELLDDAEDPPAALGAEVDSIVAALEEAEEDLDDASEGAGLMGQIQATSAPPTSDQLWLIDRAWEEVPPIIERINALTERLTALEAALVEDGIGAGATQAITVPRRGAG